MLEITHPEAEWYPFSAAVEGDEAYQGRDGIRRWWANVDAIFDQVDEVSMSSETLETSCFALGHLGLDSGAESPWRPRSRGC